MGEGTPRLAARHGAAPCSHAAWAEGKFIGPHHLPPSREGGRLAKSGPTMVLPSWNLFTIVGRVWLKVLPLPCYLGSPSITGRKGTLCLAVFPQGGTISHGTMPHSCACHPPSCLLSCREEERNPLCLSKACTLGDHQVWLNGHTGPVYSNTMLWESCWDDIALGRRSTVGSAP